MTYNWEQTNPKAELTGDQAARLSAARQSVNYPTPQQIAFDLADTEPGNRQAFLTAVHDRSILNHDRWCIVHRLTRTSPAVSVAIREVDEGDSIVRRRGVCQHHADASPPGPIVIRR
jgi:hypothetical protein